jgi:arsenate reductase (thioredoxin)
MKYVLFVCNQNAGRSQMAQAFFACHAPEDLRAESAGSTPADRVHPVVVEAMKELGIDISSRRPRKLLVEMQLHADWAVTMGCGDACPYVPTIVEDWDVPDPAGMPIEEVRVIRDEIERRVEHLLANRIEEIRSHTTAHQARLATLIPSLLAEFEGKRTFDEIRDCADAVLGEYDEAPIRTHVLAIAGRRASECLRADTCDVLARAQ